MASLQEQVNETIAGMLYLSESEAPLELTGWDGVKDTASLQGKITETTQVPAAAQVIISQEDFLAGIHRMADPADPVMDAYARQYDTLFKLLAANADELLIIRAGEKEVHLYIAAFGAISIILHTTAIET